MSGAKVQKRSLFGFPVFHLSRLLIEHQWEEMCFGDLQWTSGKWPTLIRVMINDSNFGYVIKVEFTRFKALGASFANPEVVFRDHRTLHLRTKKVLMI